MNNSLDFARRHILFIPPTKDLHSSVHTCRPSVANLFSIREHLSDIATSVGILVVKMVLQEIRRAFMTSIIYVTIYTVGVVISTAMLIWTLYAWLRGQANMFTSKKRELPPSCLNNSEYGEHCYIQIKNIKLHYVESGDKSKPLMIFLHGFPEFWYSWRHQIKYFSKHYWTVAIDLRGFGDSEKPIGVSQYKMRYLMSDLKNLIDELGRKQCILVAHNWGALIGWYFLLKYPDMVEKYVILNTPPIFANGYTWMQVLSSWYISIFQLPYFPELFLSLNDYKIFDRLFRSCSSTEKEAYKFIFGKPGALTHGLNYYRANILRLICPYRKKAADVQLPKGLLIYTDNDRFVHISNFKDVASHVENLESSFIKSGSHFLHQRNPNDVNKVMSKFLGVQDITDNPGEGKSLQCADSSS